MFCETLNLMSPLEKATGFQTRSKEISGAKEVYVCVYVAGTE
jgi:hypothetical protein